MIFPTKFVRWDEVIEWSWRLASKIKESNWKPDVVIGVGRGGYVVSRILCDLLDVERLIGIPIKWQEQEIKKGGETYLADLIRVYVKALDSKTSIDEGIAQVVAKLKPIITVDQEVDLKGANSLLVEEIVATGMHLKLAKEILERKWNAGEVKTATLVWKGPTTFTPDFYVVKPRRFVWFQFPWSRLNDYVEFLRVMLVEESKRSNKFVWSISEVKEKFVVWYGAKPDEKYHDKYLKEALNILEKYGIIKLLNNEKISVTVAIN